jgi:hypothetical protein
LGTLRGLSLGAALAFGVVLVGGCDEGTAPAVSGPVTGRWKTQAGFSNPIDVTLSQSDTVIEGSGTMDATPGPRRMVVIGHFSSSQTAPHRVILTFSGVNTTPAVLFANLSANQDSLSGNYQWMFGLPTEAAVFIRQR